ncbi:unnamed protein product [Oikopleura dioica]|uniref:Ribose-phosphate pyrophosphokinase N-terminal domain-containing protein n=1 Tax=Oikopleura dioica TaxID=34765 RepID=E4XH99_OIKDI|nr:unnamed protein product [Oikopleura dioica]
MNRRRAGKKNMIILSGNSNRELASKIATRLQIDISPSKTVSFANGETNVDIEKSVRGADAYIIQTVSHNVNDALMEMMLMAYACKSACAKSVIGVLPYLPYSKQCRMRKRGSIVMKLIAQSLSKAGFDHILTLDLHQKEIQGYFDCPVENLRASPYLIQRLLDLDVGLPCQFEGQMRHMPNACVVARTPAYAKRAQSFAERLRVDIAVIHGKNFHEEDDREIDGRGSPPPEIGSLENTYEEEETLDEKSYDRRSRTRTISGAASRRTRTESMNLVVNDYVDSPIASEKVKPNMYVVGDVCGKTCLIVEDILDEPEGFIKCAELLKENGAKMVIVIATHAVLGQAENDEALQKINNSKIDRIIVSNSIPMNESGKITVVDMSLLLSEAMRRIHHGESMSFMFAGVDRHD